MDITPGSQIRYSGGGTTITQLALIDTFSRPYPAILADRENLTLRRSLEQWFNRHDIRPRVVAEFEDSALLKVFGSDGLGLFPAPTVVENEVMAQYHVERLGSTTEVRNRFYAVSVARRLEHPAVVAISNARQQLFATAPGRTRPVRKSR